MFFWVTDAPRNGNECDGRVVMFEPRIEFRHIFVLKELLWDISIRSGPQESSCYCGRGALINEVLRRLVRENLRVVQSCGGRAKAIYYMCRCIAQVLKTVNTLFLLHANCSSINVVSNVMGMWKAVDM